MQPIATTHTAGFGGTVYSEAFQPSWQPAPAVDADLLKDVKNHMGTSPVPQSAAEPLQHMLALAQTISCAVRDVIELAQPHVPPTWTQKEDVVPSCDEGLRPPRASLRDPPKARSPDPLESYAGVLAGAAADDDDVAEAVRVWLHWAIATDKEEGTDDDAKEEGSRKRHRDDGAELLLNTSRSLSTTPPDLLEELLLSLLMRKRHHLLRSSGGDTQLGEVHVVQNSGNSSMPSTTPVNSYDESWVVCPLGNTLVKHDLRSVDRGLKTAVRRELRIIKRLVSTEVGGHLAHHAKELNTTGNGEHKSLPMISALKTQQERVLAAKDAFSEAQHRYSEAIKEARLALEDATEAAMHVGVEERATLNLLEAASLECNAVDEIRQLLSHVTRELKSHLTQSRE